MLRGVEMNGLVNNASRLKKDWEVPQFPESMQDLSLKEQFDIMKKHENNQKLLNDAEDEFYFNIMRVFHKFKHENLSDEVAASLTIAFYNDPVYVRVRDKIKSAAEYTIESLKERV